MVCSIFLILSSLKFRNICSKIVSDIGDKNINFLRKIKKYLLIRVKKNIHQLEK